MNWTTEIEGKVSDPDSWTNHVLVMFILSYVNIIKNVIIIKKNVKLFHNFIKEERDN